MEILSVQDLCKRYETFSLKNVSFSLNSGYIMGFIGTNGAGKTTTLKSILGLVHKDSGSVRVLGRDFSQNELELKQHIGFMFGGVDYYSKTVIKRITDVARRFFDNWDASIYESYMRRFALDENKRPSELSHGMRIKYSLVLALSHNAKAINDTGFTMMLPVRKRDIVKARVVSIATIELIQVVSAAFFAILNMSFYPYGNFLIDANIAYLGCVFIMFGIFNAISSRCFIGLHTGLAGLSPAH